VAVPTVAVAGAPAMASAAPSGAALIEPPPTASFWSVRSHPDAAEPVRLRIPAAAVDTRLQRPGRAGARPHAGALASAGDLWWQSFDRTSRSYRDNVIVYAVIVYAEPIK
jgi:hypothetical protein